MSNNKITVKSIEELRDGDRFLIGDGYLEVYGCWKKPYLANSCLPADYDLILIKRFIDLGVPIERPGPKEYVVSSTGHLCLGDDFEPGTVVTVQAVQR